VRSSETGRGERGGRRTASCCALLNRCISSMKRSVLRPVILSTFSASVKTSRSWAVVALVALSSLKMDEVVLAITRAIVVLPVPCRREARRQPRRQREHRARRKETHRRSPEQARAEVVRLDEPAQERALAEEVLLPDKVLECSRPHELGQRLGGLEEGRGRGARLFGRRRSGGRGGGWSVPGSGRRWRDLALLLARLLRGG